jgi:hypothetical protein
VACCLELEVNYWCGMLSVNIRTQSHESVNALAWTLGTAPQKDAGCLGVREARGGRQDQGQTRQLDGFDPEVIDEGEHDTFPFSP